MDRDVAYTIDTPEYRERRLRRLLLLAKRSKALAQLEISIIEGAFAIGAALGSAEVWRALLDELADAQQIVESGAMDAALGGDDGSDG